MYILHCIKVNVFAAVFPVTESFWSDWRTASMTGRKALQPFWLVTTVSTNGNDIKYFKETMLPSSDYYAKNRDTLVWSETFRYFSFTSLAVSITVNKLFNIHDWWISFFLITEFWLSWVGCIGFHCLLRFVVLCRALPCRVVLWCIEWSCAKVCGVVSSFALLCWIFLLWYVFLCWASLWCIVLVWCNEYCFVWLCFAIFQLCLQLYGFFSFRVAMSFHFVYLFHYDLYVSLH